MTKPSLDELYSSNNTDKKSLDDIFDESENVLKEMQNEYGVRGNNLAGGARNLAQGLSLGTADELEALVRSGSDSGRQAQLLNIINSLSPEQKTELQNNPQKLLEFVRSVPQDESYNKFLQNARQSTIGYARANPNKALALQISGALAPSLLTFGTAAPVAGTNLLARAAIAGLKGAGLGAVGGYASGEGINDRITGAEGGAVFGAGLGFLSPIAGSAIGKTSNTLRRIRKGIPENVLPGGQVEEFTLGKALSNTPETMTEYILPLRKASAAGALDIYNPAYRMSATLDAAKQLRTPSILTNTVADTSSAQQIINAARTPQLELAAKRYSDFVSSVQDTPGQGLTAVNFMNRNPIAKKILSVEPSLKGLKVGSFEWFQKAENTLNNSLPKNVDTQRLVGRKASIMNSINDISNIRETIHPGTSIANKDYAIGKAWEEKGGEVLAERLKFIGNIPTENAPSLSSKGILDIFNRPFQRGTARELITTGKLYQRPAQTLENATSAEIQAILNGLRNTGE